MLKSFGAFWINWRKNSHDKSFSFCFGSFRIRQCDDCRAASADSVFEQAVCRKMEVLDLGCAGIALNPALCLKQQTACCKYDAL